MLTKCQRLVLWVVSTSLLGTICHCRVCVSCMLSSACPHFLSHTSVWLWAQCLTAYALCKHVHISCQPPIEDFARAPMCLACVRTPGSCTPEELARLYRTRITVALQMSGVWPRPSATLPLSSQPQEMMFCLVFFSQQKENW